MPSFQPNPAAEVLMLSTEELVEIVTKRCYAACRGYAFPKEEIIPLVVAESALERHQRNEPWIWCAPYLFCDNDGKIIVGAGCFKNAPVAGQVEIGYGVAEAFRIAGFASSCVALMIEEAFARPEILAVTAESGVENIASRRVLEKNGFMPCGSRVDPEDGPLVQWILRKNDNTTI